MNALFDRDGPFKGRNARLFVVFTTLYNARAYYPVLAVLFTDLGLRLEQYLLLNAVWAAAIFLFEVPSGALADTIGRKRLLMFSAVLMVLEMSVLLFAPKDGGILLFALCLLNRFLSGTSEAAASGADEAIVYESLPEKNRESAWDQVMATAMRCNDPRRAALRSLVVEPPHAGCFACRHRCRTTPAHVARPAASDRLFVDRAAL